MGRRIGSTGRASTSAAESMAPGSSPALPAICPIRWASRQKFDAPQGADSPRDAGAADGASRGAEQSAALPLAAADAQPPGAAELRLECRRECARVHLGRGLDPAL